MLNNFSREELENIIKNQEYIIQNLRERLRYVALCGDFGACDGMDGSCHYCKENDSDLFEKCWQFTFNKEKN